MELFTIKDLENLSGIKAHTIRIWEQRYSFLHPQRTGTNIRYYNNSELKTLLNVALLNKYGFKVSRIDRMTTDEMRDKILSLAQAPAQQERIINDLIHAMVDLDLDQFEEIIDNFIMARGIERAITQIIFPFLEKIGILWITNHINPAQEHLVTNIVRQKLIVGIEGAESRLHTDKSVLLFLPEGEHHELGLLFTYYMFKSRGVKVLYLGSNVPIKDLQYVVKAKNQNQLYTHITSPASNFNLERFLNQFITLMPEANFALSGQLTHHYKKKIPAGVHFIHSLQAAIEYIGTF